MFRHILAATATVVAVGVLTAACGSDPASPGVASLGAVTTSAQPGAGSSGTAYQQALKFSQCMRSHGIKDFPDPSEHTSGGGFSLSIRAGSGAGTDLSPASSAFQKAQQACHSLLPAGGPAGNASSFDATKIGPWTECMRKHGVPNLPDPKNTGHSMQLDLSGTNINVNALNTAMQSCKSEFPGGGIGVINTSPHGGGS